MTNLHHVTPDSNASKVAAPELPVDFAIRFPILALHVFDVAPDEQRGQLVERHLEPEPGAGRRAA